MRKRLTAVILAVLVFSLIAASAASLGGIAVDGGVGSEEVIVNAACDTNDAADAAPGTENLAASFSTAWNGSNFVIDQVVIAGIDDACMGQDITIALTQGASVQNWGPVTLAANGGANEHTSTFTSITSIDAELPFTLHVTIAS